MYVKLLSSCNPLKSADESQSQEEQELDGTWVGDSYIQERFPRQPAAAVVCAVRNEI